VTLGPRSPKHLCEGGKTTPPKRRGRATGLRDEGSSFPRHADPGVSQDRTGVDAHLPARLARQVVRRDAHAFNAAGPRSTPEGSARRAGVEDPHQPAVVTTAGRASRPAHLCRRPMARARKSLCIIPARRENSRPQRRQGGHQSRVGFLRCFHVVLTTRQLATIGVLDATSTRGT